MVTGLPRLRPILGAVFAVDGPVGAVVKRLHALHRPGLVAELPAGLTAGTPLFHDPPVSTAGSLKRFSRHTAVEKLLYSTSGWTLEAEAIIITFNASLAIQI